MASCLFAATTASSSVPIVRLVWRRRGNRFIEQLPQENRVNRGELIVAGTGAVGHMQRFTGRDSKIMER